MAILTVVICQVKNRILRVLLSLHIDWTEVEVRSALE